jgi:AraC-like DNA-binding protein
MTGTKEIVLYHDDVTRLDEIKKFIDQNFSQEINIKMLSSTFAISKTTLRRHFLFHFKKSIAEYILMVRMIKAMTLLTGRFSPVSQIGMTVGYNDRSAFTHAFRKFFGNPPVYFSKKSAPERA